MSDILIFQSFGIESSPVEVPGGQRCGKWLTWVHHGLDFGNVKRGQNLSGKFARVLMSGMASSSLHQVGVPNCPVWCSSQVSKSSAVGLTVTGSLTVVVSSPSGMQKLTCLCGRLWVWSGEWAPFVLGMHLHVVGA